MFGSIGPLVNDAKIGNVMVTGRKLTGHHHASIA